MLAECRQRVAVANRRPGLELMLVLGVSLGSSAIYSILSILRTATSEAGIAGTTVAINRPLADNPWIDFGYQLAQNLLPLVPVAIAIYFISLDSKSWPSSLGLSRSGFPKDFGIGVLIAAAIGIPGLGLYFLAREFGAAVNVSPSALQQYWWTIPILILAALRASVVEEVIAVGFFFHQLRKLGLSDTRIILISASLRALYHLYQGLAGLVGNFIMGLIFGYFYKRTGRLMPLLAAHFVMDLVVFIGAPVVLGA